MSYYKEIIQFLSFKKIGDIVTRKELCNLLLIGDMSVDSYRRKLTIAKYLSSNGAGVYTIRKKIPENLSMKILYTEAKQIVDHEIRMKNFNV